MPANLDGLTVAQHSSLMTYMDDADDRSAEFPEGAWIAYMMEAVEQWCESETVGLGLGGLMHLDPYGTFVLWLAYKDRSK